jgi:hypothetical protein
MHQGKARTSLPPTSLPHPHIFNNYYMSCCWYRMRRKGKVKVMVWELESYIPIPYSII